MCSLFGVLDYEGRLTARELHALIRSLAIAAEERGTDATGIAYFGSNGMVIQKSPVRAKRFRFHIPQGARFIMGHTRMTTQGDERMNENNHPFAGRAGKASFALAHNGVIWNDTHLAARFKLPKTAIETDSYVAVQLLERGGVLDSDGLRDMAKMLKGSFTITTLTRDGLDIVRGNNPLCLWHFPELKLYIYASTESILTHGIWRYKLLNIRHEQVAMRMGDILHIGRDGQIARASFDTMNICELEGWGRFASIGKADEYAEMVRDTAKWLGVPDDEIELLFDMGYSAREVEDLIYDTPYRRRVIRDILRDFEMEYEYR